jgi:hypothetical protein
MTERNEHGVVQEPVTNGVALWNGESNKVLHNFDGDERRQFAMRMLCMAASNSGEEMLGKEIAVRYWMVHEVDFEDENSGEIVRTYRTVLVTPDMETYSYVSMGVAKSVKAIYESFGNKPLDPPLVVIPTQKTTSKKRRLYVLVPSTKSLANVNTK